MNAGPEGAHVHSGRLPLLFKLTFSIIKPTQPPHPLPKPPPAGWEQPVLGAICAIRRREATYIRRAARIRAFNMGLSYAITPLVRFCCFILACRFFLAACSLFACPV